MTALAAGMGAGAVCAAVVGVVTGGWRRSTARRCTTRLSPSPATLAARRAGRTAPAPPARLLPLLVDAHLPVPPSTAWSAWVLLAVATGVGALVLGGLGLVLVAAMVTVVGPASGLALRRGAAGRAVEAALPDALEAVASGLRSGAGSAQALAEVAAVSTGPLGEELRWVATAVDAGSPLDVALQAMADRRPHPGVRLAVAAMLLGAEAGGAHARALDGVAASVRARTAVGREVRALSSQVRLSALVIAAAPLAFAALAAGTDAATASFLLGTPLGLACLGGGLVLDAAGAWWMHRLSRVDP